MSDQDPSKSWRPATKLVRGGTARSEFEETSEALFLTSGYVYGSAAEAEAAFKGDVSRFIYSRYANPTVRMFEERLGLLEGATHCMGFASGMAAMFASVASQIQAGDRVVASRALFGSCLYVIADQLPKFGVETVLVDGTDYEAWERELSQQTKLVFLETPSNPTLEVIDIKRVAEMAHHAGAKLIVDNVFATPVLQKPLDLGADMVMYSTTKHVDGQGRTLGGALLTNDDEVIADSLTPWMRHTGPAMSPFTAWVMLKGLETLDLRVRQQTENAHAFARHLETLRGVKSVIYPGLTSHPQHDLAMAQMSGKGSTMVAVDLDGGKEAAFAFLDRLTLVDISNNLGDSKTLATHPATTTHQRLTDEERAHLGITDGMVRISVGLEDVDDLADDAARALGV